MDVDFCSNRGLTEEFAKEDSDWGAHEVFVTYPEKTKDSLLACLNKVWESPDRRPTLIVSTNESLITIMTWCSSMRIRVPDDVSVLNIGNDSVLQQITPDLDHYVMDAAPICRKTIALTRELVVNPSLPPVLYSLIGEYVQGKSIRKL